MTVSSFRVIVFLAFLCAGSVITLGAFTRLLDAGLGCPDWPGCYGHWMVPLSASAQSKASAVYAQTVISYKAWAEMVHRYVAGTLSLLMILIMSMLVMRPYRSRLSLTLSIFLFSLLGYQILLGRWTVTLKLLPIIVTQHLLGGFSILLTLWLIFLNSRCSYQRRDLSFYERVIAIWGLLTFSVLFLQMALGAWTSTNYASLSCTDFPGCTSNNFFPTDFKQAFQLWTPVGINYEGGVLQESARQTIQMTHRFGALTVTLLLLGLLPFARRLFQNIPALRKVFYIIIALLMVQLCLGIVNVLYQMPLVTAVLHTVVAASLLLAMSTFLFNLFFTQKTVSS